MKQSVKQAETILADDLRRYYLEAMGIQAWAGRYSPAETEHVSTAMDAAPSGLSNAGQSPPLSLTALEERVSACQLCALSSGPLRAAGEGNPAARLVLVLLSPPGTAQNKHGAAGRAVLGEEEAALLTKMLQAIDMDLAEVFITTVVKCAVPAAQTITAAEVTACSQHLKNQLSLIRPERVYVLGETAAQCLLGISDSLATMREQHYTFEQVPLQVSYAPADLLKQPEYKRQAWHDLQQLTRQLQADPLSTESPRSDQQQSDEV